ncbi:MAG TPA: CbiX/SirB N-terminal domain-containing protein [Aquabacterium sp.]|nr:CbiX/SirB N-terminal domain-containing protein [Aquabacterium sp.]
MNTSGILLFAHGARDPAWATPFAAAATKLQQRSPSTPVKLAFLEFMTPGILDAGQALAEAGCQEITVVPLFLGAGGHVRKDLPRLLEELTKLHPRVHWKLSPAVGETELLIDALADSAWALANGTATLLPPASSD